METETIEIVDRGRGPQLSTTRITVSDVFYWFHRGYDWDQVHERLPMLSREELDVVIDYVNEHHEELVEEDRRMEEYIDQRMAEQHARGGIFAPPDENMTTEDWIARLREKMNRRIVEKTVKGILADVHMSPDVEDLVRVMKEEPWTIFWDHLGLALYHFRDFGLKPSSADLEIWQVCQAEQLIFITNNRNKKALDSLEAAIRSFNTPNFLPVFTVGKLGRLQKSKAYAERVVRRLYDYLLDIDRVRGAGRLYLP